MGNDEGAAADTMKDDPSHIAEWLLQEHGPERAYDAALEGALEAQSKGDNYRLSVWREVKHLLARRRVAKPIGTTRPIL